LEFGSRYVTLLPLESITTGRYALAFTIIAVLVSSLDSAGKKSGSALAFGSDGLNSVELVTLNGTTNSGKYSISFRKVTE
jgi:hypothetical protein